MFDILIRSLNVLLMIAMPLALGVYLYRKLGAEWSLFGIGVVTFIASQLFHIPFNTWVLNPVIEQSGLALDIPVQLMVISLLLGLSAGVFEEVARYIVYRFWLKEQRYRTWTSALMFGAGHGGIEAIILGILVVYGFVQLFALKDANLEAIVPVDQLETVRAQVELFWSLPWYAAILGAVERAAAICIHLSASVLVLQVFRRGSILWLFLAISWHAAVDALAVFALQTWGVYIGEALVVGAGLLSIGIVFFLRENPSKPDDGVPVLIEEKSVELETQKLSIDHLEDSRYV